MSACRSADVGQPPELPEPSWVRVGSQANMLCWHAAAALCRAPKRNVHQLLILGQARSRPQRPAGTSNPSLPGRWLAHCTRLLSGCWHAQGDRRASQLWAAPPGSHCLGPPLRALQLRTADGPAVLHGLPCDEPEVCLKRNCHGTPPPPLCPERIKCSELGHTANPWP